MAYLQSIGVSYIFAWKKEMDLEAALDKLWGHFFINALLLEGGSEINGAFERAGLVDELSLVQVPVIADADSKSLFENSVLSDFVIKEVVPLAGGAQWLRFLKKNNRTMPSIKLSAVLEAIEMTSDIGSYFYDLETGENAFIFEDSDFGDDEDSEIMEPELFTEMPPSPANLVL